MEGQLELLSVWFLLVSFNTLSLLTSFHPHSPRPSSASIWPHPEFRPKGDLLFYTGSCVS